MPCKGPPPGSLVVGAHRPVICLPPSHHAVDGSTAKGRGLPKSEAVREAAHAGGVQWRAAFGGHCQPFVMRDVTCLDDVGCAVASWRSQQATGGRAGRVNWPPALSLSNFGVISASSRASVRHRPCVLFPGSGSTAPVSRLAWCSLPDLETCFIAVRDACNAVCWASQNSGDGESQGLSVCVGAACGCLLTTGPLATSTAATTTGFTFDPSCQVTGSRPRLSEA